MVIDSKESSVSKATRKFERTLLPRSLDIVSDVMALCSAEGGNAEVEYMVADFRDAFFIIPNSFSERRYFVVRHRGRYIAFVTTTQGSRGYGSEAPPSGLGLDWIGVNC